MDDLIGKLSETMARPASRRGFMGTLLRVGIGSAAAVSGAAAGLAVGGGAQDAFASPLCCPGPSTCQVQACPPNTTESGTYCCYQSTKYIACNNCYSIPNGDYICTYATNAGNCQQAPRSGTRPA